MTPKEKADELVDKMYDKVSNGMKKNPTEDQLIAFYLYPEYMNNAKQCALVSIDELIYYAESKYQLDWFREIRNEIEKL